MKSFNIFVDRHSIQSDLIIVNLPVRNDIAAYNWLTINSELVKHIIAEKAMSPTPSGVALDANARTIIEKYEIVGNPVAVGAEADFKVLFPITVDEGSLELEQTLQEVAQKIERVSLPISIGTDDKVEVFPLKTVGNAESVIELEAVLNEVKNSIIDGSSGQNGVITDATLSDPFAIYHESATNTLYLGASVQSLGYLSHMRLIQNGVIIGVNSIDFDLYRSLGKLSARIAIGADTSLTVQFFIDGENDIAFSAGANLFSTKSIRTEPEIMLGCAGAAVLRRLRTLAEIDAFGTLADIDNMSLDEMYYIDILE